ncbi:unnamed protein product [Ectocarpus sp. CCAP 1310/34]|nr:unnamed protein product [Ectocarpus sp. CCAP 1310/34]
MSLSFLFCKPWHPATTWNQKKIWEAEQAELKKKKDEAIANKELKRDSDRRFYENLAGGKPQDASAAALNFMYNPPPGYQQPEEEELNDDDEAVKKFKALAKMKADPNFSAATQSSELEKLVGRRVNPGVSLAEQQERFPFLKDAPVEHAYAAGVKVNFKPFNNVIRHVRCMRCGEWGHRSGDRECSVDENPHDAERQKREDPMSYMAAASGGGQMESSTYGGGGDDASADPDSEYVNSLSTKKKRRLLKLLQKMEEGGGEARKSAKKKDRKGRKKRSSSKQGSRESDGGGAGSGSKRENERRQIRKGTSREGDGKEQISSRSAVNDHRKDRKRKREERDDGSSRRTDSNDVIGHKRGKEMGEDGVAAEESGQDAARKVAGLEARSSSREERDAQEKKRRRKKEKKKGRVEDHDRGSTRKSSSGRNHRHGKDKK